MKKISVFYCILCMFCITNISAQEAEEENSNPLETETIENQFNYILEKSTRYKSERNISYKVIRQTWLDKVQKNTIDSLSKSYAAANNLKTTISQQQKEITDLKNQIQTTNNQLKDVTKNKDSISLFGINLSKGLYKSIMWGIICLLSILLVFFIYKFKNSNMVTQEAKQNLTDIEAEFEDHRRKALEREQKVRRELQDLINLQRKRE